MAYNAIICKLQNVREHPNADRIKLATIYGSQVVIGLDNEEGELGVFFPSDGQLMSIFLKENNLYRKKEYNKDTTKGGYFEDKGRVRTQKFREEKSDGMWLPISCLDFCGKKVMDLKEDDQFDTIDGILICKKYINPKTLRAQSQGGNKKKKIKEISFPLFNEHADTNQLAYNSFKIPSDKFCVFTLKMHGTSGRTTHTKEHKGYIKLKGSFGNFSLKFSFKKMKKIGRALGILKENIIFLFKVLNNNIKYIISKCIRVFEPRWRYVTGTRRVVLDNFDDPKKLGFYGNHDFRKIYHDQLVNNLRKGETIYYEIVGWESMGRPFMGRLKNSKLKDKEFSKKYGDETIFTYGCELGESDMYIYRITMTNEDGDVIDYSWDAVKNRSEELGLKHVPELKRFIHDGDPDKLMALAEKLAEGADPIDPTHIREGVVLRVENGNHFNAYKHKSFEFKVLEGIWKDSGEVDIEEAEGEISEDNE